MAKKVVASLQKGDSRGFTKVIKMVKSQKGTYQFQKAIVRKEKVDAFFSSSKS